MKKFRFLIPAMGLIIFITSCGSPSESQVDKYFQVMRMLDRDSMASMALNPVEIEFTDFEIVKSTEPYEVELLLPKYLETLNELEKQKKEMLSEATDIEGEKIDLEFEIDDTRSRSKKAELQEELDQLDEKYKSIRFEFTKLLEEIEDMENLIQREKVLVKKSTSLTEEDGLINYDGVIKKSEVFVDVTLPTGKNRQYVFILVAYELKKKGEENAVPNRMVIENILTLDDYQEMQMKESQEEETPAAEEIPTEEIQEEDPQTETVKAVEGEKTEETEEEK